MHGCQADLYRASNINTFLSTASYLFHCFSPSHLSIVGELCIHHCIKMLLGPVLGCKTFHCKNRTNRKILFAYKPISLDDTSQVCTLRMKRHRLTHPEIGPYIRKLLSSFVVEAEPHSLQGEDRSRDESRSGIQAHPNPWTLHSSGSMQAYSL